jgi:hypothetical protein
MKEPLSIVVSNGAEGLKVQSVGLSCGEARASFDKLCSTPAQDWIELVLYERLKPRKSRRFTHRQNVVTEPTYIPPPPVKLVDVVSTVKRAAKIIRRGR